jgi:hypothetical protein
LIFDSFFLILAATHQILEKTQQRISHPTSTLISVKNFAAQDFKNSVVFSSSIFLKYGCTVSVLFTGVKKKMA